MKIDNVFYSSHFAQAFKKLPKDIQEIAFIKEKIFRQNCFEASLKTHKLKGVLSGYWSFSINYSYRLLFEFQKDGSVAFIDIGGHSVYR